MAYRVTMTQEQLDFWHALLAPFQDHELSQVPRGGKTLTYLDKRALENRLDTVCGPQGWWNEFQATDRGMICTIHILVPVDKRDPGYGESFTWLWIAKSDGGGAEGMVKKAGVEDEDNDFKSEFTNAFRRAAQDAWGIGRYLYKKGVPGWIDPSNLPLEPGPVNIVSPIALDVNEQGFVVDGRTASRVGTEIAKAVAREREATHRFRDVPVESPVTDLIGCPTPGSTPVHTPPEHLAKPATDPQPEPPQPIQLPRNGRSAFGWAKEMERTFDVRIVQGMIVNAKDLGWSETIRDWDAHQTKTICLGVAAHLMTTPKYAGQFNHLSAEIAEHVNKPKPEKAPTPGVNVADLRKTLKVKMEALINKQTGRAAEVAELKAMLEEVATQCPTERGTTGEVPESLAKTTDPVWLGNMIKCVDDQSSHAKSNMETDELADVPF